MRIDTRTRMGRRTLGFVLAIAISVSGGAFMGTVTEHARPAYATATPGWWSGDCDANNNPGAHPLGAAFNGVKACGGGSSRVAHFYPGAWGEYEWECVELSMRFLYLTYGIVPYGADGKDVVANYSGSILTKVSNTGGSTPTPGDVVSFAATSTNPYGHTAVVTTVNVNGAGSGTATLMEQNASPTGSRTVTITNKILGAGISGWLHDQSKNPSTSPVPPPPPDTDADGTPDTNDRCPHIAGSVANYGCPIIGEPITADFNGDGKDDTVHIWQAGLNTWFARGDGTYSMPREGFKPPAAYNINDGFLWRTGDFNGDRKDDIVQFNIDGVNLWLSHGDGTYTVTGRFRPRTGYRMTGGFDWRVVDVNADGKADLLHLWAGGVNTWLSNGDGTFRLAAEGFTPFAGYNMTGGFAWKDADVNGDHRVDLVHLWSGGINVWLARGDGTYTTPAGTYLPRPGYGMTGGTAWLVADVDADGKADLLHLWAGGVNTLLSNGDGTFKLAGEGYRPANYSMIDGFYWMVADFTGDGRADLVHLWAGGANLWTSNGDGTYDVANPWMPRPGYGMTGGWWRAADVNADGKADLTHYWTGGINTWISQPGTPFRLAAEASKPYPQYGMTNDGNFYP